MSGEVLMTLGSIRFSVAEGAYQRLQRKLAVEVARLPRAGAQSARQVLGEDETLEIEGVVYPDFTGSITRLDDLRALARTHQPQMLTDGTGKVWGSYVVEAVEEEASHHLANGVAMRQGFRLSLGLWG